MLETKTPIVPTAPGIPVPYQFLPKGVKVIVVFTVILFLQWKTQGKHTVAGCVGT